MASQWPTDEANRRRRKPAPMPHHRTTGNKNTNKTKNKTPSCRKRAEIQKRYTKTPRAKRAKTGKKSRGGGDKGRERRKGARPRKHKCEPRKRNGGPKERENRKEPVKTQEKKQHRYGQNRGGGPRQAKTQKLTSVEMDNLFCHPRNQDPSIHRSICIWVQYRDVQNRVCANCVARDGSAAAKDNL